MKEHTKLAYNDFIEAINIILNNFFSNTKITNTNNNGWAISAPISPILAKIVIDFYEESILQNLKFPIIFLKLYVDHFITAICKYFK